MRVKCKQVLVFVAGVSFGYIVSFMNLLTLVDLQGRVRNHSIGFYELNNMEFLRQEHESRRLAAELGVRVACWVLTSKRNNFIEAKAVKKTWGRRCDKLVFISTQGSKSLGIQKVDVPDGWDRLWNKTKAGLRYVYDNLLNDADWFLKADDDTYVIMENLRSMLVGKNSSELLYFGYRFKTIVKKGYMSGGSGYVLSRAALKLVVEKGLDNATVCPTNEREEDVNIGFCLENLGVPNGDSRDELGRNRFFPMQLGYFVNPFVREPKWLIKNSYYPINPGLKCCSDSAISIHYIEPEHMFRLEYLIYYLRVHRAGLSQNRTE